MKSLYINTESDKELANKESIIATEDIAKYVSSFYDTHISKFKERERER